MNKDMWIMQPFDSTPFNTINEMIEWCRETLYHGGNYEPNWYCQCRTFYFCDEQEYLMFMLRWA